MIALHLSVPIASWRKGHAREFLETEVLPPPATCYGALLALCGEADRDRHRGCRVTAGLLGPLQGRPRSLVLRTLWQIKKSNEPQGNGANAGPDFQQLVTGPQGAEVAGTELVIWCESSGEAGAGEGLEARVVRALRQPATVVRYGGWSLGESTHLINDAWLLADARPPQGKDCHTFVVDPAGSLTLPVWVDHVGTAGTRYAVGRLLKMTAAPEVAQIPCIDG